MNGYRTQIPQLHWFSFMYVLIEENRLTGVHDGVVDLTSEYVTIDTFPLRFDCPDGVYVAERGFISKFRTVPLHMKQLVESKWRFE